VANRKILPCRESSPGTPAPNLVTILTELSQLLGFENYSIKQKKEHKRIREDRN
jgi:hypothetical protein